MAIKKQEFYEGAALHLLARTGLITNIIYEPPFFRINNNLLAMLKYSTRGRSPWGFTFTIDEQGVLENKASQFKVIIALICGSDGVAAFSYESYQKVAIQSQAAIHIACYRQHGEYYVLKGPNGKLASKIAPSNWQRILEKFGSI